MDSTRPQSAVGMPPPPPPAPPGRQQQQQMLQPQLSGQQAFAHFQQQLSVVLKLSEGLLRHPGKAPHLLRVTDVLIRTLQQLASPNSSWGSEGQLVTSPGRDGSPDIATFFAQKLQQVRHWKSNEMYASPPVDSKSTPVQDNQYYQNPYNSIKRSPPSPSPMSTTVKSGYMSSPSQFTADSTGTLHTTVDSTFSYNTPTYPPSGGRSGGGSTPIAPAVLNPRQAYPQYKRLSQRAKSPAGHDRSLTSDNALSNSASNLAMQYAGWGIRSSGRKSPGLHRNSSQTGLELNSTPAGRRSLGGGSRHGSRSSLHARSDDDVGGGDLVLNIKGMRVTSLKKQKASSRQSSAKGSRRGQRKKGSRGTRTGWMRRRGSIDAPVLREDPLSEAVSLYEANRREELELTRHGFNEMRREDRASRRKRAPRGYVMVNGFKMKVCKAGECKQPRERGKKYCKAHLKVHPHMNKNARTMVVRNLPKSQRKKEAKPNKARDKPKRSAKTEAPVPEGAVAIQIRPGNLEGVTSESQGWLGRDHVTALPATATYREDITEYLRNHKKKRDATKGGSENKHNRSPSAPMSVPQPEVPPPNAILSPHTSTVTTTPVAPPTVKATGPNINKNNTGPVPPTEPPAHVRRPFIGGAIKTVHARPSAHRSPEVAASPASGKGLSDISGLLSKAAMDAADEPSSPVGVSSGAEGTAGLATELITEATDGTDFDQDELEMLVREVGLNVA